MAANVFKQLSDSSRLRIFWLLCHCEQCVVNISSMVEMSSPAVSHHLRILKEAGVVAVRREGTRNYYYFDAGSGTLNALDDMLQHAHRLMQYLAEQGAAAEPTER